MRRRYLISFFLYACVGLHAQVESLLKKARSHVENGHLKEAIADYKAALRNEPANRDANLGLGLIYSEWLDNYPAATPYLESAYAVAVKDSSYDLIFALAKCYHYAGDFDRALSFYNRLQGVQDLDEERNFQAEVTKRRDDCEYARAKKNVPQDNNIYLVNCGKTVNTEMPEYVPVLVGSNELLFTSKRKDSNREELNYLDGKYFESMYIVKREPNTFTGLRRYTLPDKLLDSKFYKHHQAVVSLSQDGTRLFTFHDSRLYEISVDERQEEHPAQVKIRKFDHYANHAFLTRDGNTLYFTSEMEGGMGGTDIYRCTKSPAGEWGSPVNLGAPVNTSFNEDAPFIASDGTLYFASEGHEGYGNYDIYRSYFSEGKWAEPENLGEPINSPGHDVFLVLDSMQATGYFSSGRNGGFGDMDLYKILYLDKFPRDCTPYDEKAIWLSTEDADSSDFRNTVRINLGPNYRMLESEWQFMGSTSNAGALVYDHDYGKTGQFPLKAKIMAWCDTCLSPVVACIDFENRIEKRSLFPPVTVAAGDDKMPDSTEPRHDTLVQHLTSEKAGEPANAANTKNVHPGDKAAAPPASEGAAGGFRLGASQLAEMGYSNESLQFGFNEPLMTKKTEDILKQNVEILKRNSSLRISIFGYADARGSEAVNQRISLLRARNIRQYLISEGLPQSQISEVKGKGATSFLNHCSAGVNCSEEEHALNRRVEIEVFQTARIK